MLITPTETPTSTTTEHRDNDQQPTTHHPWQPMTTTNKETQWHPENMTMMLPLTTTTTRKTPIETQQSGPSGKLQSASDFQVSDFPGFTGTPRNTSRIFMAEYEWIHGPPSVPNISRVKQKQFVHLGSVNPSWVSTIIQVTIFDGRKGAMKEATIGPSENKYNAPFPEITPQTLKNVCAHIQHNWAFLKIGVFRGTPKS